MRHCRFRPDSTRSRVHHGLSFVFLGTFLGITGAPASSSAEALPSKDRLHPMLDRDATVCQPVLAAADTAMVLMLQTFRHGLRSGDATGAVFMKAFDASLERSTLGPHSVRPLENAPATYPTFHSFPIRISKTSPPQTLVTTTLYTASNYITEAYLLKFGDLLRIVNVKGHPFPFVFGISNPDPSTVEREVDFGTLMTDQIRQDALPNHLKTTPYMVPNGLSHRPFGLPPVVIPAEGPDKTLLLIYTDLPNESPVNLLQESGMLVTRLTSTGYETVCWFNRIPKRR